MVPGSFLIGVQGEHRQIMPAQSQYGETDETTAPQVIGTGCLGKPSNCMHLIPIVGSGVEVYASPGILWSSVQVPAA